jgi:hypothetical protein
LKQIRGRLVDEENLDTICWRIGEGVRLDDGLHLFGSAEHHGDTLVHMLVKRRLE